MRTLVETIHYMHQKGFVHRDIKPENILLKRPGVDSPIKVTDFGLVGEITDLTDATLPTGVGTLEFAAPEVLKNEPCTSQVDVWSLGVVAFVCLGGYPPFHGADRAQLIESVKTGNYTFASPYWDHVSDNAKDFVRSMMTVDPEERLTCDELLQHSFITNPSSETQSNDIFSQALYKYNFRRKLRRGVRSIMAVNRLVHILQEIEDEDIPEEEKAEEKTMED